MDKGKWINETINSVEGMKRAEPNPFLFPKILNRLKNNEKSAAFIPIGKTVLFFSSILILIMINLGAIIYKNSQLSYDTSADYFSTEYIPSQQNPYLEIFK